ncbi:FAD-dependent oxidoreductase [Catenuloplanes sp. NPDC051500]|uniref:FAD-dependent oxidoreductase n=1 Tax=Catenuloplanes sp. NPDC051500 TaxID=3363959 RepID=UPI003790F5EC
MSALTVAIVGAGPAGIHAAGALGELAPGTRVDLLERLPTPYGLVRYGVAPDHPRIKRMIEPLHAVLAGGEARLLCGVEIGPGLTVAELRGHYDAVIIATGALRDVPADLPGSFGAADFVAWYGGHPDAPPTWPLDAASVAVIGAGNVALDVTRMLIKRAHPPDLPPHVRDAFAGGAARDVHLIVRRGPADVRFSPDQLRELGAQDGVDLIVNPADLTPDPHLERMARQFRPTRQVLEMLRTWSTRTPTGSRRVHLHFYRAPVAVSAGGLRVERTLPDGYGHVAGSGEFEEHTVQAVYRAIGYAASPLEGVPFDRATNTIPHRAGAVLGEPGLYVTGWIKRGCAGLVGATAFDARQTVTTLLGEAPRVAETRAGAAGIRAGAAGIRGGAVGTRGGAAGTRGGAAEARAHAAGTRAGVDALLAAKGISPIDWAGWLRIAAAELDRGVKITDRTELIRIAHAT